MGFNSVFKGLNLKKIKLILQNLELFYTNTSLFHAVFTIFINEKKNLQILLLPTRLTISLLDY